MKILLLQTDGPQTLLAVFEDSLLLVDQQWDSGRELARDLLLSIVELLGGINLKINELEGIVCYEGPGSFTSLRIGITTANTLAYALGIPIVSTTGDDYVIRGIERLLEGENETVVIPNYGSEPNITLQKK